MAEDEHGGELRTANSSDREVSSGTLVEPAEPLENPGLPAHHHKVTDTDSAKEKNAARVITLLFWISLAFTIFAVLAYFIWPIDREDITSVRWNNMFVGLGIAFGMLSIGFGAVAWSKYLMKDEEMAEARHKTGARRRPTSALPRSSSRPTRSRASAVASCCATHSLPRFSHCRCPAS